MLKVHDYECPKCGKLLKDQLEEEGDTVLCKRCDAKTGTAVAMERLMSAPTTFTTIVPMHPGSKALKAGSAHLFKNRPAEKTQVGYGGSVSKDHPTGGTKPQN